MNGDVKLKKMEDRKCSAFAAYAARRLLLLLLIWHEEMPTVLTAAACMVMRSEGDKLTGDPSFSGIIAKEILTKISRFSLGFSLYAHACEWGGGCLWETERVCFFHFGTPLSISDPLAMPVNTLHSSEESCQTTHNSWCLWISIQLYLNMLSCLTWSTRALQGSFRPQAAFGAHIKLQRGCFLGTTPSHF